MFTAAPGGGQQGGGQQARTLKTSFACDNCRRKKMRCDGWQPCDTCSESQQECSYEEVGGYDQAQQKVRERYGQQNWQPQQQAILTDKRGKVLKQCNYCAQGSRRKCDGGNPCRNCASAGQQCTYPGQTGRDTAGRNLVACDYCRQVRKKCDGQQPNPCSQCSRLGRMCTYGNQLLRGSQSQKRGGQQLDPNRQQQGDQQFNLPPDRQGGWRSADPGRSSSWAQVAAQPQPQTQQQLPLPPYEYGNTSSGLSSGRAGNEYGLPLAQQGGWRPADPSRLPPSWAQVAGGSDPYGQQSYCRTPPSQYGYRDTSGSRLQTGQPESSRRRRQCEHCLDVGWECDGRQPCELCIEFGLRCTSRNQTPNPQSGHGFSREAITDTSEDEDSQQGIDNNEYNGHDEHYGDDEYADNQVTDERDEQQSNHDCQENDRCTEFHGSGDDPRSHDPQCDSDHEEGQVDRSDHENYEHDTNCHQGDHRGDPKRDKDASCSEHSPLDDCHKNYEQQGHCNGHGHKEESEHQHNDVLEQYEDCEISEDLADAGHWNEGYDEDDGCGEHEKGDQQDKSYGYHESERPCKEHDEHHWQIQDNEHVHEYDWYEGESYSDGYEHHET